MIETALRCCILGLTRSVCTRTIHLPTPPTLSLYLPFVFFRPLHTKYILKVSTPAFFSSLCPLTTFFFALFKIIEFR